MKKTTFEIKSGKMVVSDPSYQVPRTILENVKNGTWVASTEIRNCGDFGDLVHWLYAAHTSNESGVKSKIYNLGVHSEQLGFFDSEFYRNDEMAADLPKFYFCGNDDVESGDSWHSAVRNLTLSKEQWGVLPMGVVSKSGLGNRNYYGEIERNDKGEIVSIIVFFLCDELIENLLKIKL